ncbi:enoyl-CoA hydratase/isomerase family protein [Pseudomarimonas salicorniae]|uniref:Enoyl-CoA hydratase-related protein n=1 Tax=Pseudomarimonas salicorniae TaxID=2933270 RepID=A0ABT0GL61_9GAMM|nr:enoyl-CoA hydratase-related protein [Lysobacter sp. CAU 1642]MCK7595268.1 enoyl-CoA hydratase-related protein [Lysobacter sp. CAU 1642]
MSLANLLIEDRGAVRRITVNRPDKLNALNRETIAQLHHAFAEAAGEPSVRVVVLAGAGNKAFVAGADISELASQTPVEARDTSRFGQQLMSRIEALGKPVIAEIGGYCLGGGMELAMGCHLRIASEKARFGQPEVNLGLIPGFGGTQRLLRLAGRSATLELCLTGEQISAERAYQLGIVSRLVAAEELEAECMKLAEHLAGLAPQALRGVLDSVIAGGEAALPLGLEFETQAFAVAFSTEDMREGTSAFLERRKPQFQGR